MHSRSIKLKQPVIYLNVTEIKYFKQSIKKSFTKKEERRVPKKKSKEKIEIEKTEYIISFFTLSLCIFMEPPPSYSYSPFSFSVERHPQVQMHDPILFFLFFASLSSILFLSFSLFKRFSKRQHHTAQVPTLLPPQHAPKKKKKKPKKKRTDTQTPVEENTDSSSESALRLESASYYPFTSSSSFMQRKIKQQYDELVKCNHLKKLTLPQVFLSSIFDFCFVRLRFCFSLISYVVFKVMEMCCF